MDFLFIPDGFHFLVQPGNTPAEQWMLENTEGQWFGWSLFVEGNYAHALAEGMRAAGFQVEGI